MKTKKLQPIIEGNDIEIQGKVFVGRKDYTEDNHDVNEEEKQVEAEDVDYKMQLQGEKQFHGLAVQNDN